MKVNKVNIFISYAHEDLEYKKELDKFLIGMKRSEEIEVWEDEQLQGGMEWNAEIKAQLNNADLILLLISIDFLNSNYIWRTELQTAMQRHELGDAVVIPIIARSADWSDMPFRKLQGLPRNGQTIEESTFKDRTYTEISKEIKSVVREIQEKKKFKSIVFATSDEKNLPKLFLSVATPHTQIQVNYITDLKAKFVKAGYQLATLQDGDWNDEDPIKPIYDLMKKCIGCVVLLMERYYIDNGMVKRGSENEKQLTGLALSTPWCQIEATLAYTEGIPLMVLKDRNVLNDGVFIDQIKKFKQVKIDIENFGEWNSDDKMYIFDDFIEKVKRNKK
jgi:hypothetical protein